MVLGTRWKMYLCYRRLLNSDIRGGLVKGRGLLNGRDGCSSVCNGSGMSRGGAMT